MAAILFRPQCVNSIDVSGDDIEFTQKWHLNSFVFLTQVLNKTLVTLKLSVKRVFF